MRTATLHGWIARGALTVLLTGCNPTALTGRAATFQVTASLVSNTCGPQAVSAPTTLVYSMVLDANGTSATWHVPVSGVSATGSYVSAQSAFHFEADSQSLVRAANPTYGIAACTMARADIIDGTITGALPLVGDAGAPNVDAGPTLYVDGSAPPGDGGPPTFHATETLVIGATTGSDCSDQIGATSGQFTTLPCEVIYQLDAVMSGPATP